ncbi:unnamed protein product (macronuclear) [Paramecium tetraurelia]|uniref:Zinc finger LSD1-type domain-containing protein n=1 Tax=Paramecium tetraurelia TaxID=5888 RepID=A0C0L8_PARTE|nr:uncharacterized protein GSPATT00006188001 [Paramecium tetraurelia]CAK64335.1 unnamed protein product [Paramecium tetraurelia]|eukprot:XP_001431733.1 hypothetical protein (macronuclear) [Paramecium tetraurelia strain d4-2]
MNQNDANLGLLSNKSKAKYKEPKQNNEDFEIQDYGDEQEYVSFDDAKVQHAEVIQPKQIEQPISPPQNNIQSKSDLQNNQNQQQAQQQNQFPAQSQIQYPQFQQQQQVPINIYPVFRIYIIQNQYSQYQYAPYQNQQYSQPQNQNQNPVSNVLQQTSMLIDKSINQRKQTYSTCIHCKTPQMIQDEKQPFMCFKCQQVNKPNFGYFQCGSCKITVMYQCGLSNLIRCTKCQTMNYVQQSNLPNTLQQYQQQQLQQQNLPQQQQQQINISNSQSFQFQNQCTNQQNLYDYSQYQQMNKESKSVCRNQVDPMYQEK